MFAINGSVVHVYSVSKRSYLGNSNLAIDYRYGTEMYFDTTTNRLIVALNNMTCINVYALVRTAFWCSNSLCDSTVLKSTGKSALAYLSSSANGQNLKNNNYVYLLIKYC